MQLSDLQYLMGQLGPVTSDILLIIQQSDDQWQVVFEDDLSLHVSWQQQRQCIIFSCGLGYATKVAREQVYALLLNANLLLAGISGARLALSQPDDEVMLVGEYPMSSPSTEVMHQILREFLGLALKYADLIASPSPVESLTLLPALQGDVSGHMQRV
jgi:hypothetical protein